MVFQSVENSVLHEEFQTSKKKLLRDEIHVRLVLKSSLPEHSSACVRWGEAIDSRSRLLTLTWVQTWANVSRFGYCKNITVGVWACNFHFFYWDVIVLTLKSEFNHVLPSCDIMIRFERLRGMHIIIISLWVQYQIGCDETCTPLLDQGVVEASGSLLLLTFAVEKIRADSSSFKLSFK